MSQTEDQQEIAKAVDQFVGPLVYPGEGPADGRAPGGIVGVFINDREYYFPLGTLDATGSIATKDTIFGLGSVTKTFTTSILGQREDLFQQSVAAHLPSGFWLHPEEAPVTFQQLATFTGGIVPSWPPRWQQHESFLTQQNQFAGFIRRLRPPNGVLPAPNVYSDSSIGLLGQILMNIDGAYNYDAESTTSWYRDQLFSYLGMEHTCPPPEHVEYPFAMGFREAPFKNGSFPYQSIDYEPWCPWGTAGRMFSTAEDMVRFIMANVGVETIDGRSVPEPVLNGMVQALEPRVAMGRVGKVLRQAFAWIVCPEDEATHSRIRGKDGGVPGVSAFLSVNPEMRYGAILMLNMAGVLVQEPVIRLMEDLRTIAVSG